MIYKKVLMILQFKGFHIEGDAFKSFVRTSKWEVCSFHYLQCSVLRKLQLTLLNQLKSQGQGEQPLRLQRAFPYCPPQTEVPMGQEGMRLSHKKERPEMIKDRKYDGIREEQRGKRHKRLKRAVLQRPGLLGTLLLF